MFKKMLGNRGILLKKPANVVENFEESKFTFILWNLVHFHKILPLKCYKTMKKQEVVDDLSVCVLKLLP